VEETRAATVGDLPRLVELAEMALDELAGQRGGWVWSRREARARPVGRTLAAAIEDPDQHVVAGLVEGYVAGYGVARLEALRGGAAIGVVSDLYTEPLLRGVGVGEAMMEDLVAFCRRRGCVGVDSLALPGDRETKNFFESFGLKARALLVHATLEPAPPGDGAVDHLAAAPTTGA
jgi:GNAT superfamily N-acetyltransferase